MSDTNQRKAPRGLVLTDVAAEILGRSEYSVRELARTGRIPHYRPFGPRGRIAYDVAELEAFVRNSHVAADSALTANGR